MLFPNGSTTRPRVSSPYGPRDASIGIGGFHAGTDFTGFNAVRAIAAGRVTFAGWMNSAAGNTIIIDHGNRVRSVYMHNASHSIRRGARVTEGQAIAVMGDTGNATGNCVHLEIRTGSSTVNPIPYITARLSGSTGSTTSPEEDDMPIIIVQRTNMQLAKGRMVGGGKIQEITRAENIAYRAAKDAVEYVTVADDVYADLLAGRK